MAENYNQKAFFFPTHSLARPEKQHDYDTMVNVPRNEEEEVK